MQNRDQLGSEVLHARERLGYRNRSDFAKAAGVSLRSVSALERGERVGKKVIARVENTLGWTVGKADRILTGKDPAEDNTDLRDEVEREIWRITDLDEDLRWSYIYQRRSRLSTEAPESSARKIT